MMHADMDAGTADVERPLDGEDPVALAPDLLAIPLPGHTEGSVALLYRETFLFTGDHVWWDVDEGRLGASRSHCWFEWVCPGHGGPPWHAGSAARMQEEVARLVERR